MAVTCSGLYIELEVAARPVVTGRFELLSHKVKVLYGFFLDVLAAKSLIMLNFVLHDLRPASRVGCRGG